MVQINYPAYNFKIRQEDKNDFIYDEIRRKWLVLTPEEWVRQNFIQYLIEFKKYPASLIAVEKEIKVGELRKRFDIVVYKNDIPWMIIECKQMNVKLASNVLQQILSYHSQLQASFIIITNGNETRLWHKQQNDFIEINEIPSW